MRHATSSWVRVGIVCLVLWPVVVTAYGDWRVGQAQEQLKEGGIDPGPIDGVLGPRTQAALRRYQASHGLPATGKLDETTRQALIPTLSRSGQDPGPIAGTQEPWLQAPPGGDFRKLSALVPLPEFLSGLGVLYVQPRTLPVGPFLAYDRQGKLVSTIYMLTVQDVGARKAFDDLAVAHMKVDHVDMYPNDGHPGVPIPHYHIILWYIPEEQAEALK